MKIRIYNSRLMHDYWFKKPWQKEREAALKVIYSPWFNGKEIGIWF